jgi:GDP-D-mannose dehydratase
MLMKKALITEIIRQDGSCLAGFLINKNYQLDGIKKGRASLINFKKQAHYSGNFFILKM